MTTKMKEIGGLTRLQVQRIERNRQKASKIRQSQLAVHPYLRPECVCRKPIKFNPAKYRDTAGGFFLEENLNHEKESIVSNKALPLFYPDRPTCEKCKLKFATSWLLETFEHYVCDTCNNSEEHALITKTEALKEYLLNESDLEKRDPPLKCIKRRNPHNPKFGEMKLYLQLQIEKKALEVWGSEEKIKEELQKRSEKRLLANANKYHKELNTLRINMRSNLNGETSKQPHTHEFSTETYNAEADTYTHVCKTCGYAENFEKM